MFTLDIRICFFFFLSRVFVLFKSIINFKYIINSRKYKILYMSRYNRRTLTNTRNDFPRNAKSNEVVTQGRSSPSSTKTLVLYWVYIDYPMVLYRPDVLKWHWTNIGGVTLVYWWPMISKMLDFTFSQHYTNNWKMIQPHENIDLISGICGLSKF